MSSMRHRLTEDQYIFLSSFYENITANRTEIWDVVDFSPIKFVFGHYIHENLLPLFRPKSISDIYLFTGVREPTSRAISQFYQLNKVCSAEIEIEMFVANYGSSMCDEIIRAFPSVVDSSKPKWLNSAAILSGFDYIYSTECYAETIGPVYHSLGLPIPSADELTSKDNIRLQEPDKFTAARISEAMLVSDDTRLYSLLLPAVGISNAGQLIAESLGAEGTKEKLLANAFCDSQSNMPEANFDNLYDYLGYELHLLGDTKKKHALGILHKRIENISNLLSYLEARTY